MVCEVAGLGSGQVLGRRVRVNGGEGWDVMNIWWQDATSGCHLAGCRVPSCHALCRFLWILRSDGIMVQGEIAVVTSLL